MISKREKDFTIKELQLRIDAIIKHSENDKPYIKASYWYYIYDIDHWDETAGFFHVSRNRFTTEQLINMLIDNILNGEYYTFHPTLPYKLNYLQTFQFKHSFLFIQSMNILKGNKENNIQYIIDRLEYIMKWNHKSDGYWNEENEFGILCKLKGYQAALDHIHH